jgi:endonuclease/exonuclease/phosphatase family metal-dependent hydrolase
VRLASFNLMHGRSLTDGLVDGDRLRDVVAGLRADVLALQEVDRDQPRSGGLDLTALAAAAMGAAPGNARFAPTLLGTPGGAWRPVDEQAAAPPLVGEPSPAYGIGLVSMFPVEQWRTVALPAAPVRSPVAVPTGPRRVRLMLLDDEPRVGLAAVLATPAGRITAVSTHLSFVPGWNVVQLRRLVRALDDLPGPVVLLGDLNMPGFVARRVTRWRSLGSAATYPAPRPRVQLDHVLARGRLPPVAHVAAERTSVSDHRALVVELASVPPPRAPTIPPPPFDARTA